MGILTYILDYYYFDYYYYYHYCYCYNINLAKSNFLDVIGR